MVKKLNEVGRAIGLTMSRTKTMVIRNEWADTSPIVLEGSALPDTDCYVYLGRVISWTTTFAQKSWEEELCMVSNGEHQKGGSAHNRQEDTS
ncbi:hypothetical protein TELCIR_21514 [Teladorsagia circumcincta]|uniref:Reverse transcriptase domain-containing protein n=1 Tax=Teladorsagia circumcincta TaxID=45464 RepID=A0A2G9TGI9_TELCI|nr:hypothetical protein TELCIR_21514 [Teladorsagia circumcincta]